MHVKIKITDGTFVTQSNSYFFAAVTLERNFIALQSELVLRVAEVGNFIILHGEFEIIIGNGYIYIYIYNEIERD